MLHEIVSKVERLRFILILAFVFSLPFDIFYSSVITITLFLTTLVGINKESIKRVPKQLWIFQLVYILGVFGYFLSLHKQSAGSLLERQLDILLFPLLLPLAVKIDAKKVSQVLLTLLVSCLVALCYLFVDMIQNIVFKLRLPVLDTALSGAFFNHQFSKPLGIHAGYLSMYVSLSIFFVVQRFNRNRSIKLKIAWFFTLAFLFSGLFFLAARNSIIATFFVLIFVFPLFNIKNKPRYLILALTCLIVSFFIIKNVTYLKERFSVELLSDIKPLQTGSYINYYSAEPRIERWKGGWELVRNSPVFGYGTGDEIDMLKTEYMKRGLYISYLENLNAHNQYLSIWIKNGTLGLLLFLTAFFYYLSIARNSRDFLYTSFLLLLLIGFYTENILDTNKGVVFFSLFNVFFGYACLSNTPKKSESEEV